MPIPKASPPLTHWPTYFTNLVLENDAEWVTFDVTPDGPEPKVEVNDKIAPGVTFGGWSIERTFPGIADEVRAIIAGFQPPLWVVAIRFEARHRAGTISL